MNMKANMIFKNLYKYEVLFQTLSQLWQIFSVKGHIINTPCSTGHMVSVTTTHNSTTVAGKLPLRIHKCMSWPYSKNTVFTRRGMKPDQTCGPQCADPVLKHSSQKSANSLELLIIGSQTGLSEKLKEPIALCWQYLNTRENCTVAKNWTWEPEGLCLNPGSNIYQCDDLR